MNFSRVEEKFNQLFSYLKELFSSRQTPTTQELSRAVARDNLFQLVTWVRWELIFFFSVLALMTALYKSLSVINLTDWLPYIIILVILFTLNIFYHRYHLKLCMFESIYYIQFGLDILLISWLIHFSGVTKLWWGFYIPVVFIFAFVFRHRTSLWIMIGWIAICYAFLSWFYYYQVISSGQFDGTSSLDFMGELMINWFWVVSFMSITALIGAQLLGFTQDNMERLKSEVIFDPLTALYNRRYFFHMLNSEIERSRRFGHTFSLMLIDLDNFKKFNDTFGHLEGDKLLQAVAKIFRSHIRRSTAPFPYDIDIPCRYGGEEFVIILPEVSSGPSRATAERIKDILHQELAVMVAEIIRAHLERSGNTEVQVTASIGVATYPTHGDNAAKLIQMADAAMYEAKRRGKNRVVTADVVVEMEKIEEAKQAKKDDQRN